MATTTHTPTADGRLLEDDPGTADGTATNGQLFAGTGSGDEYRVPYTFDISEHAAGSTVNSASFATRRTSNSGGGADVTYSRLSTPYAETDTWTTHAGLGTTPIATQAMPLGTDAIGARTTIADNASFIALVQDAIDNRSGILSFMMEFQTKGGGEAVVLRFREDATAGSRPLLTLDVSPPAAGGGSASGTLRGRDRSRGRAA